MKRRFKNLIKLAIGHPALFLSHALQSCMVYVEERKLNAELGRCGKNVVIVYPWDIRNAQDIEVGEGTFIGPDVLMIADRHTPIEIGSKVMLGPRVRLIANQHRIDDPNTSMIDAGYSPVGKIVIEDGSWIGTGAAILKGVKIGRGAVVGAGAVVTKDVPPYEIWGGNPARKIRSRLESSGL